jgi:hypothetical protein
MIGLNLKISFRCLCKPLFGFCEVDDIPNGVEVLMWDELRVGKAEDVTHVGFNILVLGEEHGQYRDIGQKRGRTWR